VYLRTQKSQASRSILTPGLDVEEQLRNDSPVIACDCDVAIKASQPQSKLKSKQFDRYPTEN
jgi:hypothetical protein